jgi:uncharacterized membrane protein YqgA involved in biofilm formation
MIGTLINAGAILLGGTIGLVAHSKLPPKITKIVFQAIGIFTMFVGIQMALKSNNYVLIVFSLLIGSIIGELFDFETTIQRLSKKLTKKQSEKTEQFINAIVTTFILYCMGSMAILGAIEDGLGYKPNLLIAKSILDGFSSIALSAAFGPGVIFQLYLYYFSRRYNPWCTIYNTRCWRKNNTGIICCWRFVTYWISTFYTRNKENTCNKYATFTLNCFNCRLYNVSLEFRFLNYNLINSEQTFFL